LRSGFFMFFGISVLALFLLLSGCSSESYPVIFLDVPELEQDKGDVDLNDEGYLKVALASITSARESLYYYNDLLAYLEEETGKPVRIVQRKTYAEVNDLIKNQTVDVGFICTYSYVLGRDDFGMELLATPVKGGKKEYHSYIIKRKGLDARDFYDLQNRSFAFTDPISNSGRLYPLYLLQLAGENPDSFFSSHIYTFSHDNSIRAVAEGLVDAAAVDSLVYDHLYSRDPAYFENIEIIQVSQPFGIQPIVIHPDMDEELKESLSTFFLTLHQNLRGQEILHFLGFDQFDRQEDSAYDSIREIAKVVGYVSY
jgi:phosphonate transport system substrate-binding protein